MVVKATAHTNKDELSAPAAGSSRRAPDINRVLMNSRAATHAAASETSDDANSSAEKAAQGTAAETSAYVNSSATKPAAKSCTTGDS